MREPSLKTGASLAADLLLTLSSVAAGVVSYTTHRRSLRPSTLLCLYLSALLLLSVPRVRTFYLFDDGFIKERALIIVSTVLGALLFLAELTERHGPLKSEVKETQAPEEVSSFWNRAAFFWLSATFLKGYSRILGTEDLPALDSTLRSSRVREELLLSWDKCKKQLYLQFQIYSSTISYQLYIDDKSARHSLLRASFRAFWPSMMLAVVPRICLTVFNFTQPSLLEVTVKYIGQDDPDTSHGKGLIGAWALVFLGLAVSTPPPMTHCREIAS